MGNTPFSFTARCFCCLAIAACYGFLLQGADPKYVKIHPQKKNSLVVWNMNVIFPFSWEFHHPNWRSLHDFSEGEVNHQPDISRPYPSSHVIDIPRFDGKNQDLSRHPIPQEAPGATCSAATGPSDRGCSVAGPRRPSVASVAAAAADVRGSVEGVPRPPGGFFGRTFVLDQ